ncbi:MAG: acyl--CoA ligase [Gemmatimonas sp.]|nr:acyl--CoA ligase [Gemmatimonas sp.]
MTDAPSDTGVPSPQASLYDPIAHWADVAPARPAVIDAGTGRSYSYADVHADAERYAQLLTQLGVGLGDRVAVLAHNRYAFVPLFLACIRCGAILVPLNWRLSAVELSRVLSDAAPTVIFGEHAFRALNDDARNAARWVDLDRDVPALLETIPAGTRSPAAAVAHAITPLHPTMLLYTSGSTGAPKGVMVPHRQLLYNAIDTVDGWALSAHDCGAVATPFFHTSGWHVFATPLWYCGGTVVILGPFHAATMLELLDRHRVTMVFVVPTQLAWLRQAPDWGRPVPLLRTFISGGAHCAPSLQHAVREAGYRVRDAYGLTECGPNCFTTTDEIAREFPDTVGRPLPRLSVRLVGTDGTAAGVGETGELQLRGPQLFGGYFQSPDETANAFTADGWLQTGDLATVDEHGLYRLRGRRREMFISGGENVYPGEVEAALLDCPGVDAALVTGVADDTWGEVGHALVVALPGHWDRHGILVALRARLAGYKIPRELTFVEQLPTLANGKVDRVAAARLLAVARAVEPPGAHPNARTNAHPLAKDARVGDH